ncbi:hypothetical protein CLOM_g5451 [Closterium sp. NIES-68]|nr:hypothetical protein CLOM_g5451 [Closterium sp. NIES-68]GJP61081.1 hypothetical protein CLOP_g18288 [Closterium sp. NIES-67]
MSSSARSTALLEKRMTDALAARHKSVKKVPKNFDAFVLKFPRINAGLELLREVYDKFVPEGREGMTMDELKAALGQLQVTVSEGELKAIFEQAEFDPSYGEGSETVTEEPTLVCFNAFVLCLGIVFLLESADSEQKSRLGTGDINSAFQIIVDAFIYFDEDHDGQLTRVEIEKGFSSRNSLKEGTLLRNISMRMEEMDRDSNGVCTFVEFLNAFVGWVGSQYADADADADEHA